MPETEDRDLDLVRTSARELARRFDLGYWRKQDKQEREEQEAILDTYLQALGMI